MSLHIPILKIRVMSETSLNIIDDSPDGDLCKQWRSIYINKGAQNHNKKDTMKEDVTIAQGIITNQ